MATAPVAEEASAEEARRLLLAARLQLKEAVGDAASKAATARRLQLQLDSSQQRLERAQAELAELRAKVSAPLLTESAHRCGPCSHIPCPLLLWSEHRCGQAIRSWQGPSRICSRQF